MTGLIEKIKEEVSKHLIAAGLALVSLLVAIIWQAVPSSVLLGICDRVPKPALWAAIGILVLICLGILASRYNLQKERKKLQASLENKLIRKFGVLWDNDLTPCCPGCEKPLANYDVYRKNYTHWGFQCITCKETISLFDEQGNNLELKTARTRLTADTQMIRKTAGID